MTERIALSGAQQTMLMTLYLHARDASRPDPLLGDPYAGQLLERLGADFDCAFDALRSLRGNEPVIVGRAKAVDDRTRDFLATHRHAVVLHLGCGLDSRVRRIDPGPGVTWFDVDQEPVIDLRRRLVPARPGTTMLAASVTDTGWWAEVPQGRPTLVVGEGLLMYLTGDDVGELIRRTLSHRAPVQVLVFDTVAPWVARISGAQRTFRAADSRFRSTTADLADAVARFADTTLTEEQSLVTLARRATPGVLGALLAVIDRLPAGHRAMVLRTYERRG